MIKLNWICCFMLCVYCVFVCVFVHVCICMHVHVYAWEIPLESRKGALELLKLE